MKKNSFTLIILFTWILILACSISIAILFKVYVIDGRFDHQWDFMIYSIPLFVSALIFIMFLYNLKRAYSQQQSELTHGNCIVHWRYTETEWAQFNSAEWEKSRKKSLIVPLSFLILLSIIFILAEGFSSELLSVVTPHLIIFFSSLSGSLYFYSYSLYKRTKTCPREVVIGKKGFLFGGYYNTFEAIGTFLSGVKFIEEQTPILEFDIKVRGRYGYYSNFLRVPVPIGYNIEAENLVSILSPYISSSNKKTPH